MVVHRPLPLIGVLAVVLTVGCGGGAASASPAPPSSAGTSVNTCAKAHQSKHLAYLVVQHLSGRTIERCAGFDGDAIAANAAMNATGIQFQMVGSTMCQIDHEPQQVGNCSTEQAHWTLWLYSTGTWSMPAAGYGQLELHDLEALGWRYTTTAEASPSPPIAPRPL
jgi:hypothetical protein